MVGQRLFSAQSVDVAAQRLFCADIMADQLWQYMWTIAATYQNGDISHNWVMLMSPKSSIPVKIPAAVS